MIRVAQRINDYFMLNFMIVGHNKFRTDEDLGIYDKPLCYSDCIEYGGASFVDQQQFAE